jgi:hypothetical protein
MPIEFSCTSCRTLIRTADGTEGKPARCPKCSSVVLVPGGAASSDLATSASQAPSSWPPAPSPFAAGEPIPSAGPTPLNPYAAPTNPFAYDPLQLPSSAQLAERARSRLMAPAICMIGVALLGLGVMALIAAVLAIDPQVALQEAEDPEERMGVMIVFGSYFTFGFLTRALQILGAISMLRVRGYVLALIGAICAILPCDFYCCLPCLPFGIWALVVLNNAEVKAAFGR